MLPSIPHHRGLERRGAAVDVHIRGEACAAGTEAREMEQPVQRRTFDGDPDDTKLRSCPYNASWLKIDRPGKVVRLPERFSQGAELAKNDPQSPRGIPIAPEETVTPARPGQ